SNGGITCHAGKMVSVHKGAWDKLPGTDLDPVRVRMDKVHEFNRAWLAACQRVLKPNGSIWVSGTAHIIHSVGFAMQQLGFKLPEPWEKRFGKHPTQKPVALLERILLSSSNEGDLVLDPFLGGGTTLLVAFRLRRHALGCDLSAEFLALSLRRLCSNLVQVDL